MGRKAVLVAAALVSVSVGASQEPASSFSVFLRPDGTSEHYYAAGDRRLEEAFRLLDGFVARLKKSPNLVRGHVDSLLPLELKSFRNRAAEKCMADFSSSFFEAQHPKTGLVPYSYDTFLPYALIRTGRSQPVTLIARAQEFQEWFPSDPKARESVMRMAATTVKSYDFKYDASTPGGMWGWVDVDTGHPNGPVTLADSYGQVAVAMAGIKKHGGDASLLGWADQKLEFVWANRLAHKGKRNAAVLADQFIPSAPVVVDGGASDTDTLYLVRKLFELHRLTETAKYRDWALAVTDQWITGAWDESRGHFGRKIHADGTLADSRMYGDGKYNTLAVLLLAFEATGREEYLQRFWKTWDSLRKLSGGGFIYEAFDNGTPVKDQGFDKQQTIFLEWITRAAKHSKSAERSREAREFADLIIKGGESYMRLDDATAGASFLRTAMADHKICRVQVDLSDPGTKLEITSAGKEIFEADVPGRWAVIYLPAGNYTATATAKAGKPVAKKVEITGDVDLTWF